MSTVPPPVVSTSRPGIKKRALFRFWRGGKAEDGIDENTLVAALHTARDLDDSLRAIAAESAPRYGDTRPVASIPKRNEVVFREPGPIQPVAAQAAAPLTLESDSGHETTVTVTDSDPLDTISTAVHRVLYDNQSSKVSNFWDAAENLTNCRRETIVYVLMAIASAMSTWGNFSDAVCAIVGVVYPMSATYKVLSAPEPQNPGARDHWLRYWSIFGLIVLTDSLIGRALSIVPAYGMLKAFALLAASYTGSGICNSIYATVIAPVARWLSRVVDKHLFHKDGRGPRITGSN
uniref:Receptor expression-enhancing protein n=1 Tax=Panagrellus redivivus TaxID=6233 RepID=A0A7E4W744_PANRE